MAKSNCYCLPWVCRNSYINRYKFLYLSHYFQCIPSMHVYVLCMLWRVSECTVHNYVFVCVLVYKQGSVSRREPEWRPFSPLLHCSWFVPSSSPTCSHPILHSLFLSSHHHSCYVMVGKETLFSVWCCLQHKIITEDSTLLWAVMCRAQFKQQEKKKSLL